MNLTITKEVFRKEFLDCLEDEYSVLPSEATVWQVHNAVASVIMGHLTQDMKQSLASHQKARHACYFSAEFLVGRAVFNNLLCLGLTETVDEVLSEYGLSLNALEEVEDAALGNGGLGRLAACFLDSAATLNLPLDGYGIRYRYGLFKQDIRDGFQVEEADNWTAHGDFWSHRRDSETVQVTFRGQTVNAVPYDMPILGWKTKNVGNLRLWQAESLKPFDFSLFNAQKYDEAVAEKNRAEDISRVLYPNDNSWEGKVLRLKQQYFFCCASITDILRKFKKYHGGDLHRLPEYVTIQLNDTHPVVAIPELMRQLMDEEDLPFDEALSIVRNVFNYTNHTIMSEALEKWPVDLMNAVIPQIYEVVELINNQLIKEMLRKGLTEEQVGKLKIVSDNMVHMARLAVYISRYTNGVAQIHTEILKRTALKEWYDVYPERFNNKTNGVTQRRWLALCNRELTGFIRETLGGDHFITNLKELRKLAPLAEDEDALRRFMEIKRQKKEQLAAYVLRHDEKAIDPSTIFDVQVKRLHEYKRQFLNGLSILMIYFGIKEKRISSFYPTTFLFGAKSAPGYTRAKGIIKWINEVARLVNNDPETSGILRVEFLKNYDVSYAEKLAAAADVSVQISTAGTEASGTGNMKLMINGAVTLGTYDGANIEIVEEAGEENNYIFGARVEELKDIMPNYNPRAIYEADPQIKQAVDTLIDGTFSDGGSGVFRELYDSLINGVNWERPDRYYVLGDLRAMFETRLRLNADYQNRMDFTRKCFLNMCGSGKFSSDRTIRHYSEGIWKLNPIQIDW